MKRKNKNWTIVATPAVQKHVAALIESGIFGATTPEAVLQYLIVRSLDDLLRAGVLRKKP